MGNNISLNEVKNGAFLAKQSYETFESPKKMKTKNLSLSQTQPQILVLKLSPKQNLLMILARDDIVENSRIPYKIP